MLSEMLGCKQFLIDNIKGEYSNNIFEFLEGEIKKSEEQIKNLHQKLESFKILIQKRDLLKVGIEPTEIDISDRYNLN